MIKSNNNKNIVTNFKKTELYLRSPDVDFFGQQRTSECNKESQLTFMFPHSMSYQQTLFFLIGKRNNSLWT